MKDRRWFKAARVSTIGVIGGVLGTVAAGPIGGVAGAAIGTAVGVGASLADAFWFETLLTKPNPRRFATDVLMPRVAEQTNLPPLAVTRMASAQAVTADASRTDEAHTVATAADVPAPAPSRRTEVPTPSERRSSDAKSRRDRNKKKAQRRARRKAQRKGR